MTRRTSHQFSSCPNRHGGLIGRNSSAARFGSFDVRGLTASGDFVSFAP